MQTRGDTGQRGIRVAGETAGYHWETLGKDTSKAGTWILNAKGSRELLRLCFCFQHESLFSLSLH